MTTPRVHRIHATPRPDVPASAPCHCGQPIPTGQVAYCSPRCRWADDVHEHPEYDTEDAA